MSTSTRFFVDGDGVRLACYRWGRSSGPVLLLVHGYPDSHHTWLPLIERLSPHYQVVAYDVRGSGQSSHPGAVSDYRLTHLANDLRAVARAVGQGQPVHLIAHDWGSIQSWEAICAEGMEQLFASFTSLSGPCLDHASFWLRRCFASRSPRLWWQAISQLLHSGYIAFFQLPKIPEWSWRAGMARHWNALIGALEGYRPATDPDQLGNACRGIALYRANFIERLLRPQQRHTRVPVHLLVAQKDMFVRPQLLDDLPRWVDELERHELPAGHWQLLVEANSMARLILDYLARQQSRTPLAQSA